MSSRFSFISANLVGRQSHYEFSRWAEAEAATHAYFSPLATFRERFHAVLSEVKALGFHSVDLWGAHLHWSWATLPHLEAARSVLQELGLQVRSYAAWVPGGPDEVEAACQLCAALRIPFIAGVIFAYETHPAETVASLRRHGVRYARENHPEKSAEDILSRIGNSDTDVVGLTLDTGWCGTQGFAAPEAVRRLRDRLFVVHLKDVRPRRPLPTGREMTDLGHETCALGAGVVDIEGVLQVLRETDFRGPIGIEHEPEDRNPLPEVAISLATAERLWTLVQPVSRVPRFRIAIVGCGNIAQGYGAALQARPELEILGAFDVDPARAQAWANQFGGRAYATLGELLADPRIECVVNLTIPAAHVEVVTAALLAGKHVHSEKPLAPTYAEAVTLVELAKQQGRRLSCAPITWLGEAQQTAWKLLREGRVGTPRAVYVGVDWARIETWHPAPESFYGVGPVFDVAVYPLTLLTAWFGPVRSITADGDILLRERRTLAGKTFTPGTEDFLIAVLTFDGGLKVRLTANYYVGEPIEHRSPVEVHGDRGSLLTTWYSASGMLKAGPFGGRYQTVHPVRPALGEGDWFVDWSAGVVELSRAVREERPHPTQADHHLHVIEVMEAVHRAARAGERLTLTSEFTRPEPLGWAR